MQRRALESGTSHHRGPIWKPERGSFTAEFVGWTKQDYGNGGLLYGHSVRGTWREGSFSGDS